MGCRAARERLRPRGGGLDPPHHGHRAGDREHLSRRPQRTTKAPTPLTARAPADLIFSGGRIWTVDPARPEAEALATSGDRIVAVGSAVDVLALRGPGTEVVDLR